MESIQLGFRLEADSVRLDLRISSRGLVRLEPRLVDRTDGTDGANGADRQIFKFLCFRRTFKEKMKRKKKDTSSVHLSPGSRCVSKSRSSLSCQFKAQLKKRIA